MEYIDNKNRALMLEERNLFEYDRYDATGVDLEEEEISYEFLNNCHDTECKNMPGLSEPEAIRHFVNLSQKNYSIDNGIFPLGSCTMKHNPRLNEKMARLPGFARIHPMAPEKSVQGALELINMMSEWILKLTKMEQIAISPKAGAHGEFCGMMVIRKALETNAEFANKNHVLIPNSAHGTNPATASMCGFKVVNVKTNPNGLIDIDDLKEKLNENIGAIMITNPNTCGFFEKNIREVSKLIHSVGGYVYCDGANYNAIMTKAFPGELGIDAMHLNLHKTFSTPHGGGGPGSGPVVLSKRLADFVPIPFVTFENGNFKLNQKAGEHNCQRITAFHGQMGMFVRTMSYLLSHGLDGLCQVTEDAVLNANYVAKKLSDYLHSPFKGNVMHEALFTDKSIKHDYNLETKDIAKALIDYGFHPMTVYFPILVNGAMLIEPTETESKDQIDAFCDAIINIIAKAKNENQVEAIKNAPYFSPRRKIDEVKAVRNLIVNYDDLQQHKSVS